jgi:small-conductance mechanosensitive channel
MFTRGRSDIHDGEADVAGVGVKEVLHEPVPEFANSLIDWLIALGVTAAWFLALFAIRRLIRRYNRRLEETEPKLGLLEVFTATFSRTTLLFMIVAAAAAGLATLNPSGLVTRVARTAVMIALIWQVGVWSTAATNALLERRRQQAVDPAMAGSLSIVGVILRTAIWIIVVLVILQNAGVDVGALMAGLGIGGVAVALAMQNVLSDLFASLSITLDRPFVVGDLLLLENLEGFVEHIGLKSTRIRSIGGEQIIVSNADLLRSRVRNFGRMSERRVEFTLAIAYETAPDTLEHIPIIIRDIVSSETDTRFGRSHLAGHGVYALNFQTVYYVLSPDFAQHMDIQHSIHVRIHREFAQAGIKFAEPLPRLPGITGQTTS